MNLSKKIYPNRKNDDPTDHIAAFIVIKFVNNSLRNLPVIFKNREVSKGIRITPKIKIPIIILSKNLACLQMQILVF